jgi:thiamine pyrophosphate-dependent acetolactate synthase large subunit-like protein
MSKTRPPFRRRWILHASWGDMDSYCGNADLLIIIMNDRAYRLIEHVQDALTESRHFFSKVRNPDLQGVAHLAEMPFWRVSDTSRFGSTAN